MTVLPDHKLARDRVARCLHTVVEPARFRRVAELSAEVYQCAEPCSLAHATAATYRPVPLGFRWGPLWSTAWFRFTAELPPGTALDRLYAAIDTGTEACVWQAGIPYHGLSGYHKRVPLTPDFVRDARVTLLVEAAANRMFGQEEWQPAHPGDEIGQLREAHLLEHQPEVDALFYDLFFALQLADTLDTDLPRRRKLIFALNAAVNALDAVDVPGTAARARVALRPALEAPANASAGRCFAVGHAHIDTAWLWPVRETRRKCYRTFATALRLMERYPEYRFQQSQAQLYAFVQADAPQLFEQIRRRVAEGRWDAGGGMWVECDCNLVSGESLVRQILHGTRYWRAQFGTEQSYLWLPDTFGYSAALPQILTQAGIRTFFTQKMSWNQFNKFPHHTFWWAGLDGTPILAHFLTSDTYNSDCTPKQLRYSERAFKQSDRCNTWLYAYGWGDGGGGPTAEMLELLARAVDCEELPRVQLSTVRAFAEALHADARDLPTWDGELYLEYHRGTLTTQAANKRANRRAELALRDVEILHALAPASPAAAYPAAELDAAWKTVLLNQFHDILPGSSIGWVYEDTARDYARLDEQLGTLRSTGLAAWVAAVDTSAARAPLVAVNTLGWPRRAVVALPDGVVASAAQLGETLDGRPAHLVRLTADVPPIGHRVFDAADAALGAPEPEPARADGTLLENAWIRAEFDAAGRLARLLDKRTGRTVTRPGEPANQLVLYDDRPIYWDAWDIDVFYLEKARPVTAPASIRVVESGPLRAALRVERELDGHSRLVQCIRLTCDSARLDFETQVDWHAEHELLRVLFPLDLRSMSATYHTQFGYLQRPTHRNTSWDVARFECCGHHWCDLSEPDYGAALLTDCKYGYSCHGHVLGLSLLRSPTSPDPQADRGTHRFTYSLLPHPGDLRSGGVVQAGYALNVPLHVVPADRHTGPRGAAWSGLSCEQPNLVLETVKKAEDDDRLIVRLHEIWGQRGPTVLRWNPALGQARFVNILEREAPGIAPPDVQGEPGRLSWPHRPFGLYTVAIGG